MASFSTFLSSLSQKPKKEYKIEPKKRLAYDHYESGLKLVTIPRGTILFHERTSQFPTAGGRKYPHFAYNWYSSMPFWTRLIKISKYAPMVQYTYQVKHDIPKILWLEDWDDLDFIQKYFKFLYPEYPLMTGSTMDYGVAAFVCQVLKLNGVIIHRTQGEATFEEEVKNEFTHDVIVLCGAGEDYLELKNTELFNEPEIHPGYTSISEPSGASSTSGKVFYTPEEAQKIRSTIPKKYILS
jgi:hypothetical protein